MSVDKRDNFGFTRKCGILMPLSSLPSGYGIGTFGKPCYDFIDFLCDSGQTCWQILPLCPTAYGDSPYQSPASFAGNPFFLDPTDFYERGLIDKQTLCSACYESERVNYGRLFNERIPFLRKVHANFKKDGKYYSFLRTNKDWVYDYALFMALKVKNGFTAWTDWAIEYRDHEKAKANAGEFRDEMNFWLWVQYEFYAQWRKVRLYAHKRGIKIIGDMPIYVAWDSVDVWSKPQNYLLDNDFRPTLVAGCPPDGFSPDGQLWGNPIYDWAKMRDDGFDWWIKRVKQNFKLYDILRIDHFRGFAGYYVIPYGDATARNGRWEKGCGKQLFDAVKAQVPQAKIIAEDLGFYTEDVGELLAYTGYPGMKLMQFAFFDENSDSLPRNFTTDNCIAYTGSHDADCTYSWCKNLDWSTRERFERECPRRDGESPVYAMIRLALSSRANLAIIPMQDYLELPNEKARINTPSTPEGNWAWRAEQSYFSDEIKAKILAVAVETHREKER